MMRWKEGVKTAEEVINTEGHCLHSFVEGLLVVGETEDGFLEVIRIVGRM